MKKNFRSHMVTYAGVSLWDVAEFPFAKRFLQHVSIHEESIVQTCAVPPVSAGLGAGL